MKHISFLFCILLFLFILAVPVATANIGLAEETEETEEPTMNPVTQETTEKTAVPTTKPTTEKTPVPTETPAEVGWVTIASTPSGASVALDGKGIGVTPLAGIEVTSGKSHTVKVTMSGYEPYSTSVTVSPGEESAVDATLDPVPVTKPTTEPTATMQPVGADKGWFRIHANVEGANAYLGNGAPGSCTIASGSCSIQVSTTGTPVKSFTVEKSGYSPYTGSVSTMPAKGATIDLYATLNPVTTKGSISVTSSPSNAIATLDGSSFQYTPCTFTGVSAGSNHQVKVSKSGYQTVTRSVTVYSGDTAYVSANLEQKPRDTGSLSITSSPSGADIYVDGSYYGETPSTVPGLDPGTHTVRLHKAGYNEYVSTVSISSGSRTPLSITLSPQSSNVGSIEIMSTPGGAALYIDSHYMGATPLNSYFDATSLAPGYHTVLLRYTDYQDYTQSVNVPAGGTTTVNAVLTKVQAGPTPDSTGQVVIASSPAGAEIYIDNAYMGITPATIPDAAAGSHTLTLKLAGYGDFVQVITVTGGSSTPVAATLVAAEPTATEKAPATIVPVLCALACAGALLLWKRA